MDQSRDFSESAGLFGLLANAFGPSGAGGDAGSIFSRSDAMDFQNGAHRIPDEVTDARRAGQTVTFYQDGEDSSRWFWKMPDGSHINHG